jgi:two-component system, LytTR family, sensor kinase
MLGQLERLFRVSLGTSSRASVTLAEEVEFARQYLLIEQGRLRDRLEVAFQIAPETASALVPNLILQPLVENAVRHGIAPNHLPSQLDVTTRKTSDEQLEIVISDTGVGLPEGWSPYRAGFGLGNTRGRLSRLYGDKFRLSLDPNPNGGARVTLLLPFRATEAKN